MLKYINHPGHKDPLRRCETYSLVGSEDTCSGCNRPVVENYFDKVYCQEEGCEYSLHSWCALLGSDSDYSGVDHPLHSQHPLTLHTTTYPPNKEYQTHELFVCSFCKATRTSGFLLHCAHCDFYLDFSCAYTFPQQQHKQSLSQYEFHNFLHPNHALLPHRFSFLNIIKPCSCPACGLSVCVDDLVFKCISVECDNYYVHARCSRVLKDMTQNPHLYPQHPQHPLAIVQSPRPHHDQLRCAACHGQIDGDEFIECNQCPQGFSLHMSCAFRNHDVKYERHDHRLAYYDRTFIHGDDDDDGVGGALCAACNTLCHGCLYRCSACNFNIHKACLSLPLVFVFDDHVHPFTLVNSLNEDPSATYYCDVCEEKREPNHGLYCCQECSSDFVAHFECILPPSYTEENDQPWMTRKFIQEDEAEEARPLELTPDGQQLVSQLDMKMVEMRELVQQLLEETHREDDMKPQLEKLNQEAEGMLRQLRDLIN